MLARLTSPFKQEVTLIGPLANLPLPTAEISIWLELSGQKSMAARFCVKRRSRYRPTATLRLTAFAKLHLKSADGRRSVHEAAFPGVTRSCAEQMQLFGHSFKDRYASFCKRFCCHETGLARGNLVNETKLGKYAKLLSFISSWPKRRLLLNL